MSAFQIWASRNTSSICFLGSYFFLVVLGNLIFATPAGASFLGITHFPTDALSFDTSFTFGFWLLLLMPFFVTPPVVWATKRTIGPVVAKISYGLPEFRKLDFWVLSATLFSVVAFAFFQADALTLSFGGADPIASVEGRFLLLSRLSFLDKLILQSVLTFLSFYAAVCLIRRPSVFWGASAFVSIALTTSLLIALNMKWPVLVFYLGLISAVFMFSKRAFLFAIVGVVALVLLYLVIATQVFRLADSTEQLQAEPAGISNAANLLTTAVRAAPELLAHATNRMAVSYPYYYNVFTNEGPVCGGVLDQARTLEHVKCRPSLLIYTRIFGADGFENRGTAPAAVHISAYALGGWPLAIVALISASVVLGLFSSIPLNSTSTAGSFAVAGVVAGYHFSQLPGEGPIFYDHGVFWPLLLIILYAAVRAIIPKIASSKKRTAS